MHTKLTLISLAFASNLYAAPTLEQTQTAQILALQTQVATLNRQVLALMNNPIQKLGPFVSVDFAAQNGVIGPNVTLTGINLHIVSGAGRTASHNGLGNLFLGYDEILGSLQAGDRSGSHNLVIGPGHKFLYNAYAGIVQGEGNTISAEECVVIGGANSISSGSYSQVFGGVSNHASQYNSAVIGGFNNEVQGNYELLLGGVSNLDSTDYGSLLGKNNGFTISVGSAQ